MSKVLKKIGSEWFIKDHLIILFEIILSLNPIGGERAATVMKVVFVVFYISDIFMYILVCTVSTVKCTFLLYFIMSMREYSFKVF